MFIYRASYHLMTEETKNDSFLPISEYIKYPKKFIPNDNKSEPPDLHIDNFWKSFKGSVRNYYKANGLLKNEIILDKTSDILNTLQKDRKYDEIVGRIETFLIMFSRQIIRFGTHHHTNLFKTNLTRWSNITGNSDNQYIGIFLSFHLLISSEKQTDDIKNFIDYLKSIDKIDDNVWENMVFRAIITKKPKIIDIVSLYFNVSDHMQEKYGVPCYDTTSGKKIVKKYNDVIFTKSLSEDKIKLIDFIKDICVIDNIVIKNLVEKVVVIKDEKLIEYVDKIIEKNIGKSEDTVCLTKKISKKKKNGLLKMIMGYFRKEKFTT